MAVVDVYFDCSSPWTYLAFERIQPLCAETGAGIAWKPILVGGVFNAVNPSVYDERQKPVPAKAAYQRKDLEDWARYAGLTIIRPSVFPVNAVRAMRACLVAIEQDRLVPFARAVFEAYWRDDKDISGEGVIAEIAEGVGLDAVALLGRIGEPEIKNRLRALTDELISRGGFGSPTMFVGDDMYFGNDRLHLVRTAIVNALAAAGPGRGCTQ